jgi:hypothetical protein
VFNGFGIWALYFIDNISVEFAKLHDNRFNKPYFQPNFSYETISVAKIPTKNKPY